MPRLSPSGAKGTCPGGRNSSIPAEILQQKTSSTDTFVKYGFDVSLTCPSGLSGPHRLFILTLLLTVSAVTSWTHSAVPGNGEDLAGELAGSVLLGCNGYYSIFFLEFIRTPCFLRQLPRLELLLLPHPSPRIGAFSR